LYRLGDWKQAISLIERALELGQELDRQLMLQATNNLALVSYEIGCPQDALRLHEQALAIQRKEHDRIGEGTTLNNLGNVYGVLGQKQQALAFYAQALAILREARDRTGEANSLNSMGNVYSDLGQKVEALKYFKQALEIFKEVGDRDGEGVIHNNLGSVYTDLGQIAKALDYYERALKIWREVGHSRREGDVLNNLGHIYEVKGQNIQALDYYNQALGIARKVRNRAGEGTILNNLGSIYDHIGQKAQALECLEQALGIWREMGNRTGEGATLLCLAHVYYTLGQKAQALNYSKKALVITREVGDRAREATTHANIAVLLYQDGQDLQEAITHMEQALALLRETDLPQDAAGMTPDIAERSLQAMREGTFPNEQSRTASTIRAEQINIFVHNTIAVMTTLPERRAEWREEMAQALQSAKDSGTDWQSEAEFFTAILVLLDGNTPTLTTDHPYASALVAIQDGIAQGGVGPIDEDDEGDEVPEEVQALASFVQASVNALCSADPQVRMTFMQQLAALQEQTQDEDMKALFHSLQLALVGGDLAHLGDQLNGMAQQLWAWIIEGVQQVQEQEQDDIPPEMPE
jgi:tetratricopeptide (TPR) repeat protein